MKLLSLILLFALSWQLWALPSYVEFYSQGEEQDRYADGTIVQDGEIYACVWIKNGATFSGLTANGMLVDQVNNKLIGAAPLAEKGHCKPVIFMLDGENADFKGGHYELYLLDTRSSQSQQACLLPSGITTNNTIAAVNRWQRKGATTEDNLQELTPISGEITPSAIPEDVPVPAIKSIRSFGGKIVLTVANTVPYIRYTVSSGATPDAITKKGNVRGANGVDSGDLTLVFDKNDEATFFKVVRE